MDRNRLHQRSIMELMIKVQKFVRVELMNAMIGVFVFGIIFVVFLPYGKKTYGPNEPFWLVGPPLIYFCLDLMSAVLLLFATKHELMPRKLYGWVSMQIVALIVLTILGFYMVWQCKYEKSLYWKLGLCLLVLFTYKAYRMMLMQNIIKEIQIRCSRVIPVVHSISRTIPPVHSIPPSISINFEKY